MVTGSAILAWGLVECPANPRADRHSTNARTLAIFRGQRTGMDIGGSGYWRILAVSVSILAQGSLWWAASTVPLRFHVSQAPLPLAVASLNVEQA